MNKINVLSGFVLLFLLSAQSQASSDSCTQNETFETLLDGESEAQCMFIPKEGCKISNCFADAEQCDVFSFQAAASKFSIFNESCPEPKDVERDPTFNYFPMCVEGVCRAVKLSKQQQELIQQGKEQRREKKVSIDDL